MLFGALYINAQSYDFEIGDFSYYNLRWRLPDGNKNTVSIKGYKGTKSELVIPNSIIHDGITKKVYLIKARTFLTDSNITSITIPSVFIVEKEAFAGATKLEKVVLGDSVSLSKFCFDECSQLQTVVFKGKVYSFDRAFGWHNSTMQRGFYFISSTPPTVLMEADFDESVYKQVTLYVPNNSVEKYKSDSVWGKFKIEVWETDKKQ